MSSFVFAGHFDISKRRLIPRPPDRKCSSFPIGDELIRSSGLRSGWLLLYRSDISASRALDLSSLVVLYVISSRSWRWLD